MPEGGSWGRRASLRQSVVVASLLLLGALVAPATATASPEQCASWYSPASATGTVTTQSVEAPIQNYVELRRGYINNELHYWARVRPTGAYQDLWMDVATRADLREWIQCGPFRSTRTYTPAAWYNHFFGFRACARHVDSTIGIVCTSWVLA